jgi:hypothetical protein
VHLVGFISCTEIFLFVNSYSQCSYSQYSYSQYSYIQYSYSQYSYSQCSYSQYSYSKYSYSQYSYSQYSYSQCSILIKNTNTNILSHSCCQTDTNHINITLITSGQVACGQIHPKYRFNNEHQYNATYHYNKPSMEMRCVRPDRLQCGQQLEV